LVRYLPATSFLTSFSGSPSFLEGGMPLPDYVQGYKREGHQHQLTSYTLVSPGRAHLNKKKGSKDTIILGL